jgi:hypothetical protein
LENKPEWLSAFATRLSDFATWRSHSATPAYFPNNTVRTLKQREGACLFVSLVHPRQCPYATAPFIYVTFSIQSRIDVDAMMVVGQQFEVLHQYFDGTHVGIILKISLI